MLSKQRQPQSGFRPSFSGYRDRGTKDGNSIGFNTWSRTARVSVFRFRVLRWPTTGITPRTKSDVGRCPSPSSKPWRVMAGCVVKSWSGTRGCLNGHPLKKCPGSLPVLLARFCRTRSRESEPQLKPSPLKPNRQRIRPVFPLRYPSPFRRKNSGPNQSRLRSTGTI